MKYFRYIGAFSLIFLLKFTGPYVATNYYFAAAGDDATGLGTIGSPWKTIAKASTLSLNPGDSVLFKRGDSFYGSLTFSGSQAGTALNNIVIGAYGSGAMPILTGMSTVSGFTLVSGSIYETSAAVSTLSEMYIVLLDGKYQSIGRYPNANAANYGYLTMDVVPAAQKTTFSDSAAVLPLSPSWVGSRMILRNNRWCLDSSTILTQTAVAATGTKPAYTKLTFAAVEYDVKGVGYGYFFTNDPKTIDQAGEWYYNKSTKRLRMQFSGTPGTHTVQVATVSNIVDLSGETYVTLRDLNIRGCNQFGVVVNNDHVTIASNKIELIPESGIEASSSGVDHLLVTGNEIADVGDYGVDFRDAGPYNFIQNNFIHRIALDPALCGRKGNMSGAINNGSYGHKFLNNWVDSVGYSGYRWAGDSVEIAYNFMTNGTLTTDDAAAFYTGNLAARDVPGGVTRRYRKIHDNIVLNYPGAIKGVSVAGAKVPLGHGFYFDDGCNAIEAWNNIAAGNAESGFYLHNNYNMDIHDNLLFDNHDNQLRIIYDNTRYINMHFLRIKRNRLISKQKDQWTEKIFTKRAAVYFGRMDEDSTGGTPGLYNNIDSNQHVRPLNEDKEKLYTIYFVYTSTADGDPTNDVYNYYTLADWSGLYKHDLHAKGSPVKYASTANPDTCMRFVYNRSSADSVVTLSRAYITSDSVVHAPGPYTIPAHGGEVFFNWYGSVPGDPPPVVPTLPAWKIIMQQGKIPRNINGHIILKS